jgi:NhaA family Na+:H+ antiporter
MIKARTPSVLREFLDSGAIGGVLLMAAAAVALLVANSPLGPAYEGVLHADLAGMSLLHWINDGLMSVFFLLIGLEIKREFLDGQLARWSSRALPCVAAAGGVIAPGLIYAAVAGGNALAMRGWAIPTATDIAFALGVLSLLGSRVPASLKLFLATLAIVDDLVAVLIIAVFYTADLNLSALLGAGFITLVLITINRVGVTSLGPYLVFGVVLWLLLFQSGVHATIAGVVLALTIPLRASKAAPDDMASPLHRLEHRLAPWVSFIIVPLFGFANAGVSFAGLTPAVLVEPVTLGVGLGLFFGKQLGVFLAAAAAVKLGLAEPPAAASWGQLYGVSLLCGIGFTMSLFIGILAFPTPELMQEVKIGVLAGSVASAIGGAVALRLLGRRRAND